MAREERLRRRGIDTGMRREQLEAARDASVRADAARGAEGGSVPIKRVLLAGLLLFVAGTALAGVLIWQRAEAFNRAVSSAPAFSSALLGPLSGTEPVNIAFFGYAGEEGHGGTYLADSIIVLSVDPNTDTTTLIAIPRDLWVEGQPLFPENAKDQRGVRGRLGRGRGAAGGPGRGHRARAGDRPPDRPLDRARLRRSVRGGRRGGRGHDRQPRAFAYTMNEVEVPRRRVWMPGRSKPGRFSLDGAAGPGLRPGALHLDPRRDRRLRPLRAPAADRGGAAHQAGRRLPGSIGPGLALMDALSTHLATDLSAIDLALLSSHLSPDRRIALPRASSSKRPRPMTGATSWWSSAAPTARTTRPLHAYLADQLAQPIETPAPSPSGSPGGS